MTSEEGKLKFGAKVEINGELWVWERVRRGVEATLRRDGTQDDWLVISMVELMAFAGTARRESSTPLRPTSGDWPSDVLDLEKHLLEVFHGVPMDPAALGPRPAYDLTLTTQEQRINAKVAELAGTSLARSR